LPDATAILIVQIKHRALPQAKAMIGPSGEGGPMHFIAGTDAERVVAGFRKLGGRC
jgi:hypothetical protein